MPEPMIIDGTEVKPGKKLTLQLLASQLPSGTSIHIKVHVFRSKRPGPVVLLLGGLHGDEINGVEIVRRAVQNGILDNLTEGSVIAIPLLNVFGFINFSRAVPDGKDVNRSFPGSSNGSLASRVAHVLSTKILPHVDFGIDFHTGGSTIFNFPQLRVTKGDKSALKLARQFNPPFILQNKVIPRSLRKAALDMGKSIVVFEGGESQRIDERSIRLGLRGIQNVLFAHDMYATRNPRRKSRTFNESKWMRASKAGVFTSDIEAGSEVTKGTVLGQIHDLDGRKDRKIKVPFDAFVIAKVNNPVISKGDALFHLVY